MSGHSKWNNIKRKKEATDAAKAKIFTKIGREMMVVIKEGGADPNNNSKLRDLIAKAKANYVPNDNIDRLIKKAAGDSDKNNYESLTYEGYGPNGIAVIVDTLTDNQNRTAANVRAAFSKGAGNIGTPGCVSFMFDKRGQILVDREEYAGDADDQRQALSLHHCGSVRPEDPRHQSSDRDALLQPAEHEADLLLQRPGYRLQEYQTPLFLCGQLRHQRPV